MKINFETFISFDKIWHTACISKYRAKFPTPDNLKVGEIITSCDPEIRQVSPYRAKTQ